MLSLLFHKLFTIRHQHVCAFILTLCVYASQGLCIWSCQFVCVYIYIYIYDTWADQRRQQSYICHIYLWQGTCKYIYTNLRSKLTFCVTITWCKGNHADKVTNVTGMIDSVFVKIDQKNSVKRMPYVTQSWCTTICLLTRENSCRPLPSRSATRTDFATKTHLDDTVVSGQPSLHSKKNNRDKAKLQNEQRAA